MASTGSFLCFPFFHEWALLVSISFQKTPKKTSKSKKPLKKLYTRKPKKNFVLRRRICFPARLFCDLLTPFSDTIISRDSYPHLQFLFDGSLVSSSIGPLRCSRPFLHHFKTVPPRSVVLLVSLGFPVRSR